MQWNNLQELPAIIFSPTLYNLYSSKAAEAYQSPTWRKYNTLQLLQEGASSEGGKEEGGRGILRIAWKKPHRVTS